jgi:superfamily II DNA/RNA helicase
MSRCIAACNPADSFRVWPNGMETVFPLTTFADLGLSQKVLSAVTDAGYTIPTPIQAGAIPFALERRDICGIAQTGTGKTASFVLPMLSLLEKGRARARMPRTLILEPTRELAAQVAENFEKYGKNHRLNVALLIGGVSFEDQDRKLERGADVLICTPGRLLDHFERGKLLMSGVEILVIDEADRMLDMGFIPDIERIAKMIPFTRQTLFFSATMPSEIQKLADRFLQNPERIEAGFRRRDRDTAFRRLARQGLRKARCPARTRPRPDRTQERHRLLQPQEGCRRSLPVARASRLFGRRPAWRHGPAFPHDDAAELP